MDHIILMKYAPELEHNFSNLRYTFQIQNLQKGVSLSDEALQLAAKLEDSVGWNSSALRVAVR